MYFPSAIWVNVCPNLHIAQLAMWKLFYTCVHIDQPPQLHHQGVLMLW